MSDKFEFIDVEYAAYQESDELYVPSIVKMCIWMEVSRSGFYGWRDKPESATAKRRGILALYVKKSFGDSDDTYGYRRVHADLVFTLCTAKIGDIHHIGNGFELFQEHKIFK